MKLLKIPPQFASGMVLQHGVCVPIFGEAEPGSAVTISFAGKKYSTQTDTAGKWTLLLDAQTPGGPYAMEISASCDNGKTENIILEDIYAGDVWHCAGQSNMEMLMQRIRDNFPEEWEPPVNSLVRQFKVPQELEFKGPRGELSGGRWSAASQETLENFSGTAWFFAKSIFNKHRIPIGLINTAWGGTPVEAWMSREALADFPEKIALGEKYADQTFCDGITAKGEAAVKAWDDETAEKDAGMKEAWYKPETDFSKWNDINLPGAFCEAGLENFCGVIWLCKEFEAGGEFTGNESNLRLGTIIDADTVFVNGVEIGNTTYRYPPRKYRIPSGLLREGKNSIVIKVVCRKGDGGVTVDKPLRIIFENSSIQLEGKWKYRVGMSTAGPCPEVVYLHSLPTGIFNSMVAPLVNFPCRGIIWYQGESNSGNCNEYASLFTSLIKDWRDKMGREIPFLFVQLPLFGEEGENDESDSWTIIREAQLSALALPSTGMAVGLDLGEWNDIHPLNKKDIGFRLALAAERVVFNEQNTSPGPLLRDIRRHQGRLILSFDNCGNGLTAREKPHVSVVAGPDSFRLPAEIEGPDRLSVDISSITGNKPEKVLYAWADNPRDRQLYNSDGLPAIPFRAIIPDSDS